MNALIEREQSALAVADATQLRQGTAPSSQMPADAWVGVFREVGFFRCTQTYATLNGRTRLLRVMSFADTRPREAAMIFRVCNPDRLRNVSWTPALDRALEYAPGGQNDGLINHEAAHLYSAMIEPDRVLAVLNDYEWIIDGTDLKVTDHGTVASPRYTEVRVRDMPESPGKATALATLGPDYMVRALDDNGPYEIRDPNDSANAWEPQTRRTRREGETA